MLQGRLFHTGKSKFIHVFNFLGKKRLFSRPKSLFLKAPKIQLVVFAPTPKIASNRSKKSRLWVFSAMASIGSIFARDRRRFPSKSNRSTTLRISTIFQMSTSKFRPPQPRWLMPQTKTGFSSTTLSKGSRDSRKEDPSSNEWRFIKKTRFFCFFVVQN